MSAPAGNASSRTTEPTSPTTSASPSSLNSDQGPLLVSSAASPAAAAAASTSERPHATLRALLFGGSRGGRGSRVAPVGGEEEPGSEEQSGASRSATRPREAAEQEEEEDDVEQQRAGRGAREAPPAARRSFLSFFRLPSRGSAGASSPPPSTAPAATITQPPPPPPVMTLEQHRRAERALYELRLVRVRESCRALGGFMMAQMFCVSRLEAVPIITIAGILVPWVGFLGARDRIPGFLNLFKTLCVLFIPVTVVHGYQFNLLSLNLEDPANPAVTDRVKQILQFYRITFDILLVFVLVLLTLNAYWSTEILSYMIEQMAEQLEGGGNTRRAHRRMMERLQGLGMRVQGNEQLERELRELQRAFEVRGLAGAASSEEEANDTSRILTLNELNAKFPPKQVSVQRSSKEGDEGVCAVCQEDLLEGELERTLGCGHVFHVQCIDLWLARSVLCPVCNGNVHTTLHPASSTPPQEGTVVLVP